MKKIVLLITTAVLLAACKQSATPQSQPEVKIETEKLEQLIASGKSVRCEISKTDGSMKMTSYMMGKKIKTTGLTSTDQAYQGTMISDGETMYTWDETKKEGIKAKLPSPEDLKQIALKAGQNFPDIKDEQTKQDWENQGYSVNCAGTAITDSDFIPPTDVKFTDMSAVMENVNKIMKTDTVKLKPGEQPSEEQIQQLLEQYQGQ